VFNDLLRDLNPLDLTSSLAESVSEFYTHLEKAFDMLPRIKVNNF